MGLPSPYKRSPLDLLLTSGTWSETPPYVRRLLWWFALPVGVVAGAGAAALILPWATTSRALTTLGPIGVPLAVFFPMFLAIIMVARGVKTLRRRYAETEGRLCRTCLHDLRGVAASGTCPECGAPYDLARDTAIWRDADIAQR